ncbi:MAG: VOC family protein [Christensenellales bacterium]|jgi:lactoylglutathione lyase
MICHVTVKTAKLQESIAFYQWLLDLPVSQVIKNEYTHIVFLGRHQTKLELILDEQAEKINAKGLTIGFAVDNLDKKIEMLKEKCISQSGITVVDGGRFLFFTDLNGCNIQLFERSN